MRLSEHKFLKSIVNHICLLLGGSILGLFALLLVFCIPTGRMRSHIVQSVPTLMNDFAEEEIIKGYPTTLKGIFTDCLMLEHSVYASEERSLLEQVLFMYRKESFEGEGWTPGPSLIDYVSGTEQSREVEYSRYWHGYLVILKPLLFVMNLNVIRMLAAFVQLFLVGWILMVFVEKKNKPLGVAFLLSLPFLYYPFTYASLSLSICFYIMCAAILVQMKWNTQLLYCQRYGMFFCVVGMLTSYFDFLTYPLVTLCFPLCICLYENAVTAREAIKKMCCYSVEWGVGYIGLWAMKWVFTDILVGGNTITNALSTIGFRTDNVSGQSKLAGFFVVLKKNLEAFTNSAFFLIVFGLLVGMIVYFVRHRKTWQKENRLQIAGIILIVSAYPLAWYFVTQNHSIEHWMFTCKILSVSVFSLICAMGKLFSVQHQPENNKNAKGEC